MTPRQSHIRRCIREGAGLIGFKSNIPHPLVIEVLGRRGLRALWLDMEHFPTSVETMADLVRACRGVDADSVVRVGNRNFSDASRMLDSGADAIMYPRATSAEEVAELMRWTRFAPDGKRGMDFGVAASNYSQLSVEQIVARGRETTMVVQIETPEALGCMDAIASVKGVDLLFLGPGDLAFAMGVQGAAAEKLITETAARIAETAKRHNLAWGMPARNLDHARELLAAGATLVMYGSDTSLLGAEVQRIADADKPFRRA